MDFELSERRTKLTAVRIYVDQLDDLRWLISHKYHGRLKIADLIREALDQYVEREKKEQGWKP